MGRNRRKQNHRVEKIHPSFNENVETNEQINNMIPREFPNLDILGLCNVNNISINKYNETLNNKTEAALSKDLFINGEIYDNNSKKVESREYFLHYLCQVCKEIPEISVICPKCQMITYCCQTHRREHWPVHADLCEAIQTLRQKKKRSHIMQQGVGLLPEEFRKYRYNNMIECQQIVERQLEKWEEEMFLHPNVCEVCYEYDLQKLVSCKLCHYSSFCASHKSQNHNFFCESLISYRLIVQHYAKKGMLYLTLPDEHNMSYIHLPDSIESYLKKDTTGISNIEFLHISELATSPLTLLYTLQSYAAQPITVLKDITVHLIGAEPYFEVSNLEKWEIYLLHKIPNIKKLTIIFIGPELQASQKNTIECYKLCKRCQQSNRQISFQFICKLYHEYKASKQFTLPSVVCAFNAGIYRTTGFNSVDTWLETIFAMFETQNIPVIVTAYTEKEMVLDIKRIQEVQEINIQVGPLRNTYSSLKPNLNFVSDDEMPVIFKNYYFTVMTKKV